MMLLTSPPAAVVTERDRFSCETRAGGGGEGALEGFRLDSFLMIEWEGKKQEYIDLFLSIRSYIKQNIYEKKKIIIN